MHARDMKFQLKRRTGSVTCKSGYFTSTTGFLIIKYIKMTEIGRTYLCMSFERKSNVQTISIILADFEINLDEFSGH